MSFPFEITEFIRNDLTETGSSVLIIGGGAAAVMGLGTTLQVKKATASQDGYLSKEDWAAFNCLYSGSTIDPGHKHSKLYYDATQKVAEVVELDGLYQLQVAGYLAINPTDYSLPVILTSEGHYCARFMAIEGPCNIITDSYGGGGSVSYAGGGIQHRHARGTPTDPEASQSGDILGWYSAIGYAVSDFALSEVGFNFKAAQTFTDTAQGTAIEFYTTPIGGIVNATRLTIENNGNITIEDGALEINASSVDCLLYLHNNGNPYIKMAVPSQSWIWQLLGTKEIRLQNQTDGIESIRFLPNGNIGVKSSDPEYLFTIGDNDFAILGEGRNIYCANGLGGHMGSGTFSLYSGVPGSGIHLFEVLQNGKVGIKTSSPDSLLHIMGGSAGAVTADANSIMVIENNDWGHLSFLTPNNKGSYLLFGDPDDNDIGAVYYDHSNDYLGFRAGAIDMLYITAAGIGIGGAALGTSAAKVLGIGAGTAPTTAPANLGQMWVEDINGAAGYAGLHKMTETTALKEIIPGVVIKGTTGRSSNPYPGLIEINEYDNQAYIYADGDWRAITAGW